MTPPPESVSRRERPAKPALSRDGIVATAMAVLRAEGLERVTMRRLAKELDTGPMSLYVYVRDIQELHAAVLDELLAEVDLTPVAASGDWRDRLWTVLLSYIDVLAAQPILAKLALVVRLSGPRYLALVDGVLGLLLAGGVEPARAAWAVDLLLQFATTTATEQGTRWAESRTGADQEELVQAVRTADATRYPHIAAVRESLLSGHGARWRWGYDVLLSGTVAVPVPEQNPLETTNE
ncbi:TetR/AcrR family transcriptional regulator [Amycolatopsis minnesotensis]